MTIYFFFKGPPNSLDSVRMDREAPKESELAFCFGQAEVVTAHAEGVSTPLVHTFRHEWKSRLAKAIVCITTITITIIMTTSALVFFQVGGGCRLNDNPYNVRLQDFEWVHVQHVAPKCLNAKAEEGFGRGWVDVESSFILSTDPRSRRDSVGYGCWFVVIDPAFSSKTGVRVNTRRVLVVESRTQVAAALNTTCLEVSKCEAFADDFLWCQKAISMGYDSIQMVSAHGHRNELVLCYGGCVQERLHESGCVPVETRSERDGEACSCHPDTKVLSCLDQILSCGDSNQVYCSWLQLLVQRVGDWWR